MAENSELIKSVRQKFLDHVAANPTLYHDNDVERVRTNDWTVNRFILVNKNESDALKALIKAMEWRKSYGVNDRTDQYFPKELYQLELYRPFGHDKDGRETLWSWGKNHYKSDLGTLEKQFLVHHIEKLDAKTSNEGWVLVLDALNAGLSNVDMDFTKFMVIVLQDYFPRAVKHILVIDLPWVLNAFAKLILAFMSEELRNRVKFVKRAELENYISRDEIPVDSNQIPDGVKPLHLLPELGFNKNQIEKIYSIYKSILKK